MMFRRILFWCHLTAGSIAGVVIFVMSVTGVLLAFERQINSWPDSRFRAESTTRLPLQELVRTPAFQGRNAPNVTIRSDASLPVEVAFGRERTLFVDGGTGRVLGEASRSTRSFFSSVERIHRSLGGELRSGPGRPITGAANFLFLLLVISGLCLWFPKRWAMQYLRPAIWFRGGFSGRARDWNWHNTVGFWCAIPLFFIVLSGVIMSYGWANNLLYRLTGTEPPAAPQREGSGATRSRTTVTRAGVQFRSFDELLAIAEKQNSDWKSVSFRLPAEGEPSVTFTVDTGNGGQPQKRMQIVVNRATGRVVRNEGFSSFNAGRKLRTIARFLHTGEVLGLGGQIVAAVASLGGAVLVWTGLSLALRRLAGRLRRQKKSQVLAMADEQPLLLK